MSRLLNLPSGAIEGDQMIVELCGDGYMRPVSLDEWQVATLCQKFKAAHFFFVYLSTDPEELPQTRWTKVSGRVGPSYFDSAITEFYIEVEENGIPVMSMIRESNVILEQYPGMYHRILNQMVDNIEELIRKNRK